MDLSVRDVTRTRHGVGHRAWITPLLLVSLTLCGCSTRRATIAGRSETSERLCEEARRAKDRGDTRSAEYLLASAVERNPQDSETRLELSEMLLAEGNAEVASEHLKVLVDQLPEDPRCFVGLAEAMYLERRFGEAAGLVERALELDPRHARGLLLRGKIEQAQGDEQRAMQDYLRVLSAEQRQAEAKLLLAELHLKQGEARLAAPLLRQIINDSDAADPYRGRASWVLGECYAREARWSDAARALASGISSRRGTAADWTELAEAYWRSGDVKNASAALDRALASDPIDRRALAMRSALGQSSLPADAPSAVVPTRSEQPQIRSGQ